VGSAWAFSCQNKSEERHTHYPVSSNVKTSKVSKGAKRKLQAVDMLLYLNVTASMPWTSVVDVDGCFIELMHKI